MTEYEELGKHLEELDKKSEEDNKKIFDMIDKVRVQSIKILLILWKELLEFDKRDGIKPDMDMKNRKLTIKTLKTKDRIKLLQSFMINDRLWKKYVSERKARDYKYALDCLLEINEFHDRAFRRNLRKLPILSKQVEIEKNGHNVTE